MMLTELKQCFQLHHVPPHVAIRLKRVFSHIPFHKTAPFDFPKTPNMASDLRWFFQKYPAQVFDAPNLEPLAVEFERRRETALKINAEGYEAKPLPLANGHALRNYQAIAVELLRENRRILVGDDLGLGKTLIAIGAATFRDFRPTIVVVPTHLPTQWDESLQNFLGPSFMGEGVVTHRVKGRTPYELPPADVYIWRYSILAGWVDYFSEMNPGLVVFDEVQELRHPKTAKYEAGFALSQNAKACLGLTATPIYNKGFEIFNVMNLIAPGSLGYEGEFRNEWCSGDLVSEPVALGRALREMGLFLRRRREDVGLELPPINRIVHEIEHDKAVIASVEDMAMRLSETVLTGEFTERGQAARELDLKMRMITGRAKARYVAAYVEVLLENDEPVILAGWHRSVYEIWLAWLRHHKPRMYTGSESPVQKIANAKAFMDGETNLLIYSLRSGSGLDGLQRRGSIVVYGELDWSPQVHAQLTGRLNRDGQARQVTEIFLISDGGSDPPMVDLLGLKSSQAKGIVDLGITKAKVSDESRVKALARSILERKRR